MSDAVAEKRRAARVLWDDPGLTRLEIAKRVKVPLPIVNRWSAKEGWPARIADTSEPPSGTSDVSRPVPRKSKSKSKAGTRSKSQSKLKAPPKSGAASAASIAEPDRRVLIDRLYRLVHLNLEALESRMSDETSSDAEPERETRIIGNVVRNVEKLKELETEQSKRDNASSGPGHAFISPDEEDRIRRKVVAHILKLRERNRRERGDR